MVVCRIRYMSQSPSQFDVCLISCFGIAEIKNRCVYLTFLREKPVHTLDTPHAFNHSRENLNGPIRNTFMVFCWNQSETILLQNSPWSLSFTCAEELWVEIGSIGSIETMPAKQGQSRTQSLIAFWSAAQRQQVLWENAICIPKNLGIRS